MRYILIQVPEGAEHSGELFESVADAAHEWEEKYHEKRDFDVLVSSGSGEDADLYAGRNHRPDGSVHYFGESTDIRNTQMHVWDYPEGHIFQRPTLFLSGWKDMGHWKKAVKEVLKP